MKKVLILLSLITASIAVSAQKMDSLMTKHKGHNMESNRKMDSTRMNQQGHKMDHQGASKMPASERAVEYSQQLKDKLGLNNDQYQKILAVNTTCIEKKDALKSVNDDAAFKAGKKDIKDYRMAEFSKILSADQLAKLKTMSDNNSPKGKSDN